MSCARACTQIKGDALQILIVGPFKSYHLEADARWVAKVLTLGHIAKMFRRIIQNIEYEIRRGGL